MLNLSAVVMDLETICRQYKLSISIDSSTLFEVNPVFNSVKIQSFNKRDNAGFVRSVF